MTAPALVGAIAWLTIAGAYGWWVLARMRSPLPTGPHAFDPDEAVRYLGTAKLGDAVAAWPRGELVVDRGALWIRADRSRDAAEVLVRRSDVRSVQVAGTRLARRVTLEGRLPAELQGDQLRFGAAFADPAPALRALGWPVVER